MEYAEPFHLPIHLSYSSDKKASTVNVCVSKSIQDSKCLLGGAVI